MLTPTREIHVSEAMRAPGVRLAVSGGTSRKLRPMVPNWIIPGTKVRIVLSSPSIASGSSASCRWRWWSRKTPHMAYDALGLIEVDYETLPAVVDEVAAIEDGAAIARQRPGLRSHSWLTLPKLPAMPIRSFACVSINNRLIPTTNPCHRGPER